MDKKKMKRMKKVNPTIKAPVRRFLGLTMAFSLYRMEEADAERQVEKPVSFPAALRIRFAY